MTLVLLDSLSLLNRAFYAVPMLNDESGRPVNAVFGYLNMLSKLIKDCKPTHIAAAFDVKAPTFRHKMSEEYKATRKPQPEELRVQIPLMKEILSAMDIAIVEQEGFEADDIIGTLAAWSDDSVIIVTGDKDSLQLVSDKVTVWLTKRGVTDIVEYDLNRLKEDGLTPRQVVELKSLMGDSSDNISGVPGVGEKTARQLLDEYNDLDGVYAHLDDIKGKLHEKLEDNRERAYLSRELATICTTVPLDVKLDEFVLAEAFSPTAEELFVKLKFRTLMGKFKFAKESHTHSVNTSQTVDVDDEESLHQLLKQAENVKAVALVFLGGEIHLAFDSDTNYRINAANDFLSPLFFDNVIEELRPLLVSNTIKVLYNSKQDAHELHSSYSIELSGELFDVSLALYLTNSDVNFVTFGEYKKGFALDGGYASEMYKLYVENVALFEADERLKYLYYDIEMPLSRVLYRMELNGFSVDKSVLDDLKRVYDSELKELEESIYSMVGQVFNINSPKQLTDILSNRLGLHLGKKTKTGMSTGADVLESIKDDHPIVPLVLRYRTVSKLNSTYCAGLASYIDSKGKIHTTFRQNYTSTGRLSSVEPNLQNIPVRTDEGRELRKAFVASKGNKLVVADYSQIELRLLAELSGDEVLRNAFLHGKDIHRFTASLVYGVSEDEVTSEMRRSSKAVNFGIIYGMSDFGLSSELGVSVKSAKRFIDNYYSTYPRVRDYMESNVAFAKEHGYVETAFGRKRAIKELASSNFNLRSFGERVAKNMPLQGTAADIIKLAMIAVDKAIAAKGLKAKLIMQIHDELIVDTPPDEIEIVEAILKECMEHSVDYSIPLTVDVGVGNSWYEAK